MAINFLQKTTFLPSDPGERSFTPDEKARIIAVMQDAYDRSPSRNDGTDAKNMFDYWITSKGKQIIIKFKKDKFQASTNESGLVEIDPDYIKIGSYIGLDGTAIRETLNTALIHELGHALRFYQDDWQNYAGNRGDYSGANVKFVNRIYQDLGFPLQRSYTAADYTAKIIKPNYQYTNGTKIAAAVALETKLLPTKKNWSSVALGNSNDLLIGGPSANALQSGAGDDFLFGGGRNDTLDGGAGKDTAVYFGSCRDYKIDKNKDGSWTVRGKGSQVNAGTDMLRNIEFVQFDDPKKPGKKQTFELKSGGLKCQTDVAFVIDTTKNTLSPGLTDLIQEFDPPDRVVSSLDTSKVLASSLIDAIYADPNSDVHTGVVAFNDTTIGSPSQVILPFTDQDDFAARKTAAIAAINRLTASDGGDIPETPFDGLRLALNGSMGEWRYGAGTRQILLFTDAPAKDYALADEVTALAQNIGATIGSSSAVALSSGTVNTFNLTFSGSSSNLQGLTGAVDPAGMLGSIPVALAEEPIDPDPTTVQVQIFTIFTGQLGTDTAALSEIANNNGGALLTAPTNDDLVQQILAIINPSPVNQPPTIDGEKSGTVKIADNDNPRDRDTKNLELKVETFDEINTRIGTGLQTELEGEVIDLRGFEGRMLKVDTVSLGDSVYKNYIGFYAVEDAQGTLASGLKVSDAGYAEAAIRSAILRSFKTESTTDLNVTGGKILAPVAIANGTFADYLKRNPQNQSNSDIHAYFNYIGANTDQVDHFRLLGDNKFGIEDTYDGGDQDYNDIIFQMNVKG